LKDDFDFDVSLKEDARSSLEMEEEGRMAGRTVVR